jgi:hypothetical protein
MKCLIRQEEEKQWNEISQTKWKLLTSLGSIKARKIKMKVTFHPDGVWIIVKIV